MAPSETQDVLPQGQQADPHVKPTNPKDALGVRKLAWSVIPWRALAGAALGMLEGALKYGRHNYRVMGVRGSVYFDATMRHLTAWWEGQDFDPHSEAQLHHIDKAISSLIVMRDAMLIGKFTDDRPPSHEDGWIETGNAQVELLLAQYPEPKAPFMRQVQEADATLAAVLAQVSIADQALASATGRAHLAEVTKQLLRTPPVAKDREGQYRVPFYECMCGETVPCRKHSEGCIHPMS